MPSNVCFMCRSASWSAAWPDSATILDSRSIIDDGEAGVRLTFGEVWKPRKAHQQLRVCPKDSDAIMGMLKKLATVGLFNAGHWRRCHASTKRELVTKHGLLQVYVDYLDAELTGAK